MTYSTFLLIFVCIPLAALAFVSRQWLRRRHLLMLALMAAIAVIYTTPWDNYLVATGVWYYDPRLVWRILLGYVPLEEYLFFVLQSFLTGLFVLWLGRRFYPQDEA